VKTISSRRDPIVGAFRELAATPDSAGQRLLLDGVHLVREAQDAGLEFEVAAVSISRANASEELRALADRLLGDGVEVLPVGEQVIAAMSPVRTPSGIVAIVRRPVTSLADVCDLPHPLLLVSVDIQDPGNIGSLIRAAEAGGVTGVIVAGHSANPFGWKALRGSMGSTLRLPVVVAGEIGTVLTRLQQTRIRTIAAAANRGDAPDDVDWSPPAAILLGGEGAGLSEDLIAGCDARVTIPMNAPVESLNVAAAGAILIYAARRQQLQR
jgi:TrmH family RNA methyltransferase